MHRIDPWIRSHDNKMIRNQSRNKSEVFFLSHSNNLILHRFGSKQNKVKAKGRRLLFVEYYLTFSNGKTPSKNQKKYQLNTSPFYFFQ